MLVRSAGDLAPVMTGDVREEVEEAEEADDDEEAAATAARWLVLLPGDAVDDEGD
jgi:hypothetical protein